MAKVKKLEGLIAAPHTPFNSDGSVNLDMIPKQIDVLVKQGVVGAYICGTTGEGICCSVEERKAVMKKWAEYGKGWNRLGCLYNVLFLGLCRRMGYSLGKVAVVGVEYKAG